MAKETLIVFVYDIQISGRDESTSPVLYFYPTWVSSEQKSALCGQIVGTVQCVSKLFCRPKTLAVASGNFYIIFKGRFIFAVGTETNSTNLRLQHKAKSLFSLFEFLHSDLDTTLKMGNTELLSSQLQGIVDNHLRMLMYSNSILFHNSNIPLTKSLDSVYMDAVHILESCQSLEGVLGGLLLYKNKVVATQLSPDLTQRLSSADLYRIQCTATSVEHSDKLPSGIDLFKVYIPNEDYVKLIESSKKSRLLFDQLNRGEIKNLVKNEKRSQDMAIMSSMKRDQSLLFTAVPEDSSVSWDQPYIPTTKKNRPKFLNLKTTISIGNSNELKSKVSSGTPLCSQTSICSTPLKELKKVIHQHPLSICHNEDDDDSNLNKLETVVDDSGTTKKESLGTSDLQDMKKRFKSFTSIADIFTSNSNKKDSAATKFKTISDPTFPVFKEDGTLISLQYSRDLDGNKTTHSNGNSNSVSRKKTDKFAEALIKEEMSAKTNKPEKPLELLDLLTRNQRQTDHNHDEYSKTPNLKLGKLISQQPVSFSKLYHMKKESLDLTKKAPQEYKSESIVGTEPDISEGELKECSLLLNKKQDISLAVLLSKEKSKEQKDILKMVDMSNEYIDKLHKTFRHKVDSYNCSESNAYSYLYLDSDWNSIKQKGTWSIHDLTIVGYLCEDFKDESNDITEVLVRGTDNIILGQNSHTFDAFYNETASFTPGLPPPIDPIGMIQVKARKKLERDHMPVLF